MNYSWHGRFPGRGNIVTLEEYICYLQRCERLTPVVQEALDRAREILKAYHIICYIAGALTEATQEDKKRYEEVSQICDFYDVFGYAPHVYGTDPKKHPNVSPEEVRDVDYLWAVVLPTFHINFLSPMAHGNAIEEGWGESSHIPSIYVAPEAMRLSRLTKGMNNVSIQIIYKEVREAYLDLEAELVSLYQWTFQLHPDEPPVGFFAERTPKKRFNIPTRNLIGLLVFVANPKHTRYGQTGLVVNHWLEEGRVHVQFSDGKEGFPDGGEGYTPLVYIEPESLAAHHQRGNQFF